MYISFKNSSVIEGRLWWDMFKRQLSALTAKVTPTELAHVNASVARSIAGEVGFFTFTQCTERPARYERSRCFDTMPSSPSLQACLNIAGPMSPDRCSLS